jgi:hypothetical protein
VKGGAFGDLLIPRVDGVEMVLAFELGALRTRGGKKKREGTKRSRAVLRWLENVFPRTGCCPEVRTHRPPDLLRQIYSAFSYVIHISTVLTLKTTLAAAFFG